MIPVAPPDKATDLRIKRALNQPGAVGKKGFLLWVEAAYPKAIAKQVLDAVRPLAGRQMGLQRVQGSVSGFGYAARVGTASSRMGRLGLFGDGPDPGDPSSWPASVQQSAVTQVTDSGAASPSWIDSIVKLLPVLGQGYLTKQQMDANNAIFQTNLQRAQRVPPLPPIATNPTQYGLPAPTVNFGLASGTMQTLVYVVGGLGILWVVTSFMKGGRAPARRS